MPNRVFSKSTRTQKPEEGKEWHSMNQDQEGEKQQAQGGSGRSAHPGTAELKITAHTRPWLGNLAATSTSGVGPLLSE